MIRRSVIPYFAGAAIAAVVLSGCSGGPASGSTSPAGSGPKTIYLIQPPQTDAFFVAEADAATAAAKELGYEMVVVSHGEDPQKQSQLFDTALVAGAVAIIVDPAQAAPATVDAQKAKEKGVPTFVIDREISKTGVAVAQILSNSIQCANLSAEAFATAMGGSGKYLELTGQAATAEAATRSTGFHQVLDQMPGLVLAAQESADWNQEKGFSKTESVLRAHPDIKGIITGSDVMALGAIAALKAAGKTDVVVAGFDGNPDMVAAIKSGSAVATVLQPIVLEAQEAVRQADVFIQTGKPAEKDEKQLLDCQLLNKDNVANYGDWQLKG